MLLMFSHQGGSREDVIDHEALLIIGHICMHMQKTRPLF